MPSKFVTITGCKMDYLCPQKWEDFIPSADRNVAQCALCEQMVTFCTDQTVLEKLAATGKCVAYETREEDRVIRTIGIPSGSGKLRRYLDDL